MPDKSKVLLSPTQQQPLPLAFVNGEAVINRPEDLYIPPEALEVILETFEGPLDFLLYLIRKQKFDIVELPILQITQQYMHFIDAMTEVKLELAGEYLVMAAVLAEIKSRLLLPQLSAEHDHELDPRAELIRRLKEYERIKEAAHALDSAPRLQRDIFVAHAETSDNVQPIKHLPQVQLKELALAFSYAMQRANAFEHHHIAKEGLSTRERMSWLMTRLRHCDYLRLEQLIDAQEGKPGVVVTFIAILELAKEGLVMLQQANPFSHIHVKLAGNECEA
jgi:segregation and condensation protein A